MRKKAKAELAKTTPRKTVDKRSIFDKLTPKTEGNRRSSSYLKATPKSMSQTHKTTEKQKIRESKVSRTSKTINVQFP